MVAPDATRLGLVALTAAVGGVINSIAGGGTLLTYPALVGLGIPGLELCVWDEAAEPSYWFYTVLAERRDDLARRLGELGIGNSLAHKRNDRHSVFAASRCDLPGLDRFYDAMLHIPCGWWADDAARERIAGALRQGW